MRKLIATVVGSLMIGVAVLAGSQSGGGSLTVDDILANVFKAKGGLDKWHAVETLKMSGRATAQGFEVPITIYSKRPNLTRQEIAVAPGQISINAFDGSTAWMVSPMSPTPVVLAGPQAEMTKQQADFDGSLVDYKAKGTAIDLVGTETIDGVKAYHLKVTRKNGLAEHDYIDASTFLQIKGVAEPSSNGINAKLETQMSNYKEFGGIMMATRLRSLSDGVLAVELNIDSIEINLKLDDAFFKLPVK